MKRRIRFIITAYISAAILGGVLIAASLAEQSIDGGIAGLGVLLFFTWLTTGALPLGMTGYPGPPGPAGKDGKDKP